MDGREEALSLRPARAADRAGILALLRACGLVAEVPEDVAGFVVAGAPGAPRGCAAAEVHGADALLRSVATVAEARGGGHGARLAEAALALAAVRGARVAWLLTETAESFFARRGFQRVSRSQAPGWLLAHRQWQDQCPASAVLMRRVPATPERLFVYGTLRSGNAVPAARRLHARARSLGPATVRGRLLDLGAYPGLCEPGADEVAGECFLLPPDPQERAALLAELDEYEGCGPCDESDLPFRREVRVARDASGQVVPCWTYVWRGNQEGLQR
jgi:N-acetylglutamate synthase-like GNAT family acetyltransferase/gamma-glutamylcyclotransferase (GGCT)/AIG2-like uncharacterized protein YtfP